VNPTPEPAAHAGPFEMRAVAVVHSSRTEATDDGWDDETATITLLEPFTTEALRGLDSFSHIEVVYLFHHVDPERAVPQSRRPRGNTWWPQVGVFAQRAKNRPNRIGISTCQLIAIDDVTLRVHGLDAIDGTPVLDIKPYLVEFAPHSPVTQPLWSHELMAEYF